MPFFRPYQPALPALYASAATRPWPVWSGSTTKRMIFEPMTRKQAAAKIRHAKALDRATRQPGSGRHGGAVGRVALDVLETLLFDFMDYASGRLDPSLEAIARKARCCVTAVKLALKRLRRLRILDWVRRATRDENEAGGFILRQETNAYAICPETEWQGWQEPPPPEPWQWGAVPPLPSVIQQAIEAAKSGEGREAQLRALELDPGNDLAASLARIGRTLFAPKP